MPLTIEAGSIYFIVLIPIALGVLHLVLPESWRRGFIWISVLTILTAGIAVAAFPPVSFGFGPETHRAATDILFILDIALLLFFLYMGVRNRHPLIILLSLAQGATLIWLEKIHPFHSDPFLSIVFDKVSATFVLIICVVGGLITLFAVPYMRSHHQHHESGGSQRLFFTVFLLFLGAMNALVVCNNLLWLYFFWEVTTLCSFVLIGYDGNGEAVRNALRALWMNSLGGLAFLLGAVILNLHEKPLFISTFFSPGLTPWMTLAAGLLVFAGLTKAAQVPFQSWLLGAMVAPTPVSALLHSSTMVKAGVYLVLRLLPAFAGTGLSLLVTFCGAFTFVAAAFLAVSQSNAKRILAYSTISNLGLIITCTGITTPAGYFAALLLIVFHAVSKAVLFLTVGAAEQEIGSRDVEKMEGLFARYPVLGSIMLIASATMFLPPAGMLMGKWIALEAAAQNIIVFIMLATGSLATILFWLKWMGRVIQQFPMTSWIPEKLPIEISGSLLILLGSVPLVSFAIYPISMFFFAPALEAYFKAPPGNVISSVNNFIVGGGIILIILAVTLWLESRVTRENLRDIYLCGDNVGGLDSDSYFFLKEKPQSLQLSGYYFSDWFSENRLTVPANVTAVALILALLGVSFLWH